MTTRLRRTLCLVSGAIVLVGLHGCRCRECRSRSCQIGSQHEQVYELTPNDYYSPMPTGSGPMLPPPAPTPAPTPAPSTAEVELPPPIPESELAPAPSKQLIQPPAAAPETPPAFLPEPTEPAPEDSPFRGAMRSVREKFSRLLSKPHTSSNRQPLWRSSPAASRVRPLNSNPRMAEAQSPRKSTQPVVEKSQSLLVAESAASVPPARKASQTSWAQHDRVKDDFVSPWSRINDAAADHESLDIDETDGFETAPIEIPDWPSLAARNPLTHRPPQTRVNADDPKPIPVGSWVRISPRPNSERTTDAPDVDDDAWQAQRLRRIDSPGPLLVPPQSE